MIGNALFVDEAGSGNFLQLASDPVIAGETVGFDPDRHRLAGADTANVGCRDPGLDDGLAAERNDFNDHGARFNDGADGVNPESLDEPLGRRMPPVFLLLKSCACPTLSHNQGRTQRSSWHLRESPNLSRQWVHTTR